MKQIIKSILFFFLLVVLSQAGARMVFANTVVLKTCDVLYISGSDIFCQFSHGGSIGHDGDFFKYNSEYPSTSGLVYQSAYQSSNQQFSVNSFSATTTRNLYFRFNNVGSEDWVYEFILSDGVYSQPDATRIISVIPDNNTIFSNSVLSSGFTVGATWHISSSDLEALNTFFSGPENKVKLKIHIEPLASNLQEVPLTSFDEVINYILPTGFETSTSTFFLPPLTGSINSFAFTQNTDYRLNVNLIASNYYNLFGTVFNVSTTTFFTIGSTTASQATGGVSGAVASTTAANNALNPFAVVSSACNPFSVVFSVGDCLLAVIVPPQDQLDTDLTLLQDQAVHMFPFGYVTDFLSIVSATSTGSLTVLSATVPSALPGHGAHISLDLAHSLDSVLNATSGVYSSVEASSTQTFYEITSYYWNILIYLALLFYILTRLFGRGIIPEFGPKTYVVHKGDETFLRSSNDSHYRDSSGARHTFKKKK